MSALARRLYRLYRLYRHIRGDRFETIRRDERPEHLQDGRELDETQALKVLADAVRAEAAVQEDALLQLRVDLL